MLYGIFLTISFAHCQESAISHCHIMLISNLCYSVVMKHIFITLKAGFFSNLHSLAVITNVPFYHVSCLCKNLFSCFIYYYYR